METRINASYQHDNIFALVPLFGYASKGLPTLDLVGFGTSARCLKEKFIYITRNRHMKIPLKRYVICLEENVPDHMMRNGHDWLEFPALLLYWYLAEQIPILSFEDCISNGSITSSGMISIKGYLPYIKQLKNYRQHILIAVKQHDPLEEGKIILGEDLLSHIPNLNFQTKV